MSLLDHKDMVAFAKHSNDAVLFTQDSFRCGLCLSEKSNIMDYVKHMVFEEKCTMVLQESPVIKDLLLPRFKKQAVKEDVKQMKNRPLIHPLEQGNLDFEVELDNSFAGEIETGFGLKWKCKICFLTFSRKSAIANHFSLQHLPKVEKEEFVQKEKDIKDESEETRAPLPPFTQTSNHTAKLPPVDTKVGISSLMDFLDVKSTYEPLTCSICGQIFKTKQTLLAHIKVVHSEERPFTCNIDDCFLSFKTRGSLVRHQRRHTDERPFNCSHCGRAFRESGSLQRHKQSRVPCITKNINDHRYGITMPFKSQSIEPKEEKLPSCPIEDFLPAEEGVPPNLEESKHSVWQQILASSKPEKNEKELSDHPFSPIERAAENKEKEIISGNLLEGINGTPFDESKKLKNEMGPPASLPSIIRTSFACPICTKVYCANSKLLSHMKIHFREMGTECMYCKKNFSSSYYLSRHIFSHSSVRQYECCQCGKMFKLKSHAFSHLVTHSEVKKHVCIHCGRLFKTGSSKNHHMKIHKGSKEFKCSICFKSFLAKASLQRHFRIHTGEMPFKCPFCKRGFKEHGTLSRHLNHKMPCAELKKSLNASSNTEPPQKTAVTTEESCTLPDFSIANDDHLSEHDSELEDYLSEKIDLSSIYSDNSEMSFESKDDFSIPFEELPPLDSNNEYKELSVDPAHSGGSST